jgi:hypothetical protein
MVQEIILPGDVVEHVADAGGVWGRGHGFFNKNKKVRFHGLFYFPKNG